MLQEREAPRNQDQLLGAKQSNNEVNLSASYDQLITGKKKGEEIEEKKRIRWHRNVDLSGDGEHCVT